MNDLLTPEQIREITEVYQCAREDSPTKQLLRDREAIAERLEAIRNIEKRPTWESQVEVDDAVAALITAIRGEKG